MPHIIRYSEKSPREPYTHRPPAHASRGFLFFAALTPTHAKPPALCAIRIKALYVYSALAALITRARATPDTRCVTHAHALPAALAAGGCLCVCRSRFYWLEISNVQRIRGRIGCVGLYIGCKELGWTVGAECSAIGCWAEVVDIDFLGGGLEMLGNYLLEHKKAIISKYTIFPMRFSNLF